MPVDNGKFKELKQEIARAVELLKEKHEGANAGEARELLNSAKQAVNKDDFSQALDLAQKAQLAARPTTEYLLGRAKSFETEGDQSYKQADAAKAIELWRESLEEYARVREMASKRNESEVVDAIASTVIDIETDTKAAFIELGNNLIDEARKKFDSGEFDSAREEFEQARQLCTEAVALASKLGSEDEARLREMDAGISENIEACLLGKEQMLIEGASRHKGEEKEAAFSEAISRLDSSAVSGKDFEELKVRAYQGLVAARMEMGLGFMENAEKLLNQKEFYQAKEGYRQAQEHLEKVRDFTVEHVLEKEKGEADNLIDDCAANIKACTDSMLGKRERLADGRIRKVKDLRKGIRLAPNTDNFRDERIEKLRIEYDLVEYLGGGGFGDVYMAKNVEGITIAIKVLRELDKHGEEVYFRELEIWRRLSHRNIVKLIRPRLAPVPLFEMEYIEGGDLGSLLQDGKVLSPDTASLIAFDIARGLQYAHSSHNVIHTDLKPKNILLTNLGEAKVSDWGLGKVTTSSSRIQGYTLSYAAPEQVVKGRAAGEKTDTYQLGVLFYEMLTGNNPFAGGSREDIEERVLNLVPDKPSIRGANSAIEPLDGVVLRCLTKDPKDRPSIRQLREIVYAYMKESHGESLHLTVQAGSKMNLLCRNALLEAKESNYAGLLPCLEQLGSLITDDQKRQQVQNLMEEMAFRKEQEVEIGDEAVDMLNMLLRWIEYG